MTTQTSMPLMAAVFSVYASENLRVLKASIFAFAVVLFVLVNVVSGEIVREQVLRHPVNDDPNIVLSHYASLTTAPDVVLLGSSVIRFPLWLSDLKHGSDIPDYDHYGWCTQLEKQIKQSSGKDISVFDLGINSAMATDVYLVEEQLLKGRLKPKAIVFALSPRDFMDCLVPDETRTQPFEKLYHVTDLIRDDQIFQPSPIQKLDLLLRKNLTLYRYRWQCQEKVKSLSGRMVDSAVHPIYSRQFFEKQVFLSKAKPGSIPPELSKFAACDNPHNKDARWLNSIAEYEARYAYSNPVQYRNQKEALEQVAELAKRRGIRVLFLRMPATETELGLDPPGFLETFSLDMRRIAKEEGVRYIDLQQSKQYTSADFFDIAHLNTDGGEKLSQLLANEIATMGKVR